jgi:Zn-dependent M28 family amino/carboxypeptidase
MNNLTEKQRVLYEELDFLVKNWKHRQHYEDQKLITEFIKSKFRDAGAIVTEQGFNTRGVKRRKPEYYNIIASYGPMDAPRIIIGAHYDVYDNPGADDNGSGIVGLLEMSRRLNDIKLTKRIDLVAYANEEPPFFAGEDMGSAHHSQMLKKEGVNVEAMICFEMIGVFYEEEGTQDIPDGMEFLELFIQKGNFIAICGRSQDGKLVHAINKCMEKHFGLPVAVPQSATWLSMSDHINYWDEGYTAVMITDTAMLRHSPGVYSHYHQNIDTIDNINFPYMEKVIDGIERYIKSL